MILTEQSHKIEQIENSLVQLYPHQLTAIQAMRDIEKDHIIKTKVYQDSISSVTTNIGVYSDMVGAGKTISILSLINYFEKPSNKIDIPEMVHTNFAMTISYSNYPEIFYIDSNLIIVPHNLVLQWKEMLLKFKDLNFTIIKTKKDIDKFTIEQNSSKIVLVSSTQLNKLYDKISPPYPKKIRWNRIILDEPQILNNIYGSVTYFDYDFMWFICATPGDLFSNNRYRRPSYLNNYFNISNSSRMTEFMSCLVVKNQNNFVKDSLSLPQYISEYILCKTPSYYNAIRNHLPSAAALERLRANDISGAIQTFACETGTEKNIITNLTKFYEEKIKRLEHSNTEITRNPFLNSTQKNERIKKNNEKIGEFMSKISNITERVSDKMCPICLDNIENPKAITKCCQNSFCMSCILMTISSNREQKCPMCKHTLSRNNIFVEYGKEESKTEEPTTPLLKSKNAVLAQFINSMEDNRKLIIFSYYDNTFYQLTEYLKTLDSPSNKEIAFLKGRVETQMSIIHKFNEGKIKVIMMNAEYCGSGLNLQMATDIVIYHKLPKTLENQVIGRAQRPGRTTPLRITYLKYDDEY